MARPGIRSRIISVSIYRLGGDSIMSKFKARVVTAVVGLFLFCTIYISSGYAVRWYNTFRTIFAVFGEIMALWTFYRWMVEPPAEDPKHVDVTVASGDTIPDSWINPFKAIKENKNGRKQTLAAADGLPHAGNNESRRVHIPGGTVEVVRSSDGSCEVVSVSEDSPRDSKSFGKPDGEAVPVGES